MNTPKPLPSIVGSCKTPRSAPPRQSRASAHLGAVAPNPTAGGFCKKLVVYVGLAMLVGAPVRAAEPGSSGAGPRLYQRYCATCHGTRGDGRGETAPCLAGPPPQDFTRGVYKLRSTPKGSIPTDADLIRTVQRGVPGTAMPAWAGLLDATDTAAIVTYVKGFSSRFVGGEAPQALAMPRAVPAVSVERGRNVFLLMKCFTCHGVGGAGNGPDVPTLKDDVGRPIAPRNFTRGIFKGGGAAHDVYRALATGLDGTPMVSFFGDPELLVRPLVRVRDAFAKEILSRPELTTQDRASLTKFIATLPSADMYDDMEEEEQEALVTGWQWDLVHYVHHLVDRGRWWRRLLGLTPQRPLYGVGSAE